MRLGRAGKMIDQSQFGPTIPVSPLLTLKNPSLKQAY